MTFGPELSYICSVVSFAGSERAMRNRILAMVISKEAPVVHETISTRVDQVRLYKHADETS